MPFVSSSVRAWVFSANQLMAKVCLILHSQSQSDCSQHTPTLAWWSQLLWSLSAFAAPHNMNAIHKRWPPIWFTASCAKRLTGWANSMATSLQYPGSHLMIGSRTRWLFASAQASGCWSLYSCNQHVLQRNPPMNIVQKYARHSYL